jgi:hypothetical protein
MPRIVIARIPSFLRPRLHEFGPLVRDAVGSGLHGRSPSPWRQRAALRPAFVRIRREHGRA